MGRADMDTEGEEVMRVIEGDITIEVEEGIGDVEEVGEEEGIRGTIMNVEEDMNPEGGIKDIIHPLIDVHAQDLLCPSVPRMNVRDLPHDPARGLGPDLDLVRGLVLDPLFLQNGRRVTRDHDQGLPLIVHRVVRSSEKLALRLMLHG